MLFHNSTYHNHQAFNSYAVALKPSTNLWKHTCQITFFPSTIINALITAEQGQDFLLSLTSYLLYSRYSTFSTPSVYIFPVSQSVG